ncbi:sugar phosphate isomerase/epimerase [Spongiibacter taiwanensis]|uniref:sugar phosphate isomerase/epimerase family protein n=1 Tax=Spongiibacter taiwanensis TaxID=1748242 RepID=UPI0020350D58|nr:sugar phosphate isomerase/epimerase [Spongiibacter taiwanensis]USA42685.1 sugar phosphate isomerase/epimerase [Spongiibacter taiwanensis]
MHLSTCTITFRHQLISLGQIANWAKCNGFDAIELWGVHAKNIKNFPDYDRDWLASLGLSVSMVSDYLPLDGDPKRALDSTAELCRLTQEWGAKKLRTFSGGKGSAAVGPEERRQWTQRLKQLCAVAQDHGLQMVVETHPNTLADTLASTLQLIDEVDHPALKINYDVIHVWEMGSDPVEVFPLLAPLIVHMHFKNVSDRRLLDIFAPGNVYAPAGVRDGMTPLFEGAYDYRGFLNFLLNQYPEQWQKMDASLEWFGHEAFATLKQDLESIMQLQLAVNEGRIDSNQTLASIV